MPYDKLKVETDGDPKTKYEDTEAHVRKGFLHQDEKTKDKFEDEAGQDAH